MPFSTVFPVFCQPHRFPPAPARREAGSELCPIAGNAGNTGKSISGISGSHQKAFVEGSAPGASNRLTLLAYRAPTIVLEQALPALKDNAALNAEIVMTDQNGVERERLALERDRLRFERQKFAAELRLKRREPASGSRTWLKEILANPVALAIVGGFVTLMTGIISTAYTASENRAAEAERANYTRQGARDTLQADLIKKFVEGPSQEAVRTNLQFLVDAGLLPSYAEDIRKFLKNNPESAPQVRQSSTPAVTYSSDSRTVTGTGVYKVGDQSADIGRVQSFLIKQMGDDQRIVADGIFGRSTEAAVRKFQRDTGLPVTGLIGPRLVELAAADGPSRLPAGYERYDPDSLMVRCLLLTAKLEGVAFDSVLGNYDGAGLTLGLGLTLANGEALKLVDEIRQQDPDAFKAIVEERPLLANLGKPRAEALAWANSISEGPNRLRVNEEWSGVLKKLLATDAAIQAQIRYFKKYYAPALAKHRELKFTTQRSLCMLYDLYVTQGALKEATAREYERLNRDMPEGAEIGPDGMEQVRIMNFFNAVARTDTAQPQWQAYLSRRRLLFVFGRGAFNTEEMNLAANFKIELVPIQP